MASRGTSSVNASSRFKQQAPAQANLLKFRRKVSSMTTQPDDLVEPGYLTTDTSFAHVVTMIILRLCRKYVLNPSIFKRLSFYFILIVFGGILADFTPVLVKALMPVRTSKQGFLNQYFVKLGWAWTLTLTLPFVTMTSHVMSKFVSRDETESLKESQSSPSTVENGHRYNLRSCQTRIPGVSSIDGDLQACNSDNAEDADASLVERAKIALNSVLRAVINRDVVRIIIGTIVWYCSVNSMVLIERSYGTCSTSIVITGTGAPSASGSFIAASSKGDCLKREGHWVGYDISGHIFILMFSVLLMIEETAIMDGWEPFGHHLNAQNQRFTRDLKIGTHRQFDTFRYYSTFIRANFILITLLILLWEFMLIQTALFYHTMVQKAISAIWATCAWFILYRVVYPSRFLKALIRLPNKPTVET